MARGTSLVRDLWRPVGAAIAVLAATLLLGDLVHYSGLSVSWGLIVLIALLAAGLAAVLMMGLWPRATAAVWSVKVAQPAPPRARERRAERLADQCRGASPRERFTTNELQETLRARTAERLVRSHGADPADPFAHASADVSTALLSYLTANPAPAVQRTTLAAHLKEIDAL